MDSASELVLPHQQAFAALPDDAAYFAGLLCRRISAWRIDRRLRLETALLFRRPRRGDGADESKAGGVASTAFVDLAREGQLRGLCRDRRWIKIKSRIANDV